MKNDLKDKPAIERLSSDKLMGLFARTPFIACVLLAIVLHVALFGVTSASFIWKTYIAKEQPAAAGAATNAAPEAATATNLSGAVTGAVAAVAAPASPAPAPATNPVAAPNPEDAELARHQETPTVKAISEAAKPEEIPQAPNDIGISIEDTNPF